jgi:hypothetical protein
LASDRSALVLALQHARRGRPYPRVLARGLRGALPPPDPCSPAALAERIEALAALEYFQATPEERARIDAERAAAAEAYARDPEGYLAGLRTLIATCAADHAAEGNATP